MLFPTGDLVYHRILTWLFFALTLIHRTGLPRKTPLPFWLLNLTDESKTTGPKTATGRIIGWRRHCGMFINPLTACPTETRSSCNG